MDSLKSIAIPVTRKANGAKAKRAGHPASLGAEHRVGGTVGERRRAPSAVAAQPEHIYQIGQRLLLRGGGSSWARASSACKVLSLLPRETGPLLYRVRSEVEAFERVVAETDLTPIK
ncbi:MAG: hypothetical protein P4M09_17570 [Devosia sp.]|nr:hypothetical protein [Devosia sp.]